GTDSSDLDEDGLPDDLEVVYKTNPRVKDSDGDSLLDGEEVFIYKTDPTLVDTDFDFLCDTAEIFETGTNPLNPDSDYDGLLDGYEIITYKSNPFNPDTDLDFLLDFEEAKKYHTGINIPDSDGDGLLDGEEVYSYNTDPLIADTDGDGMDDFWEVHNNHNPLVFDNWNKIVGYYIIPPTIAVILVIVGIFVSMSAQKNQLLTFRTEYEIELQKEEDKKFLFNILKTMPENRQLSLSEVAAKVGCSIDVLKELMVSLFDDSNDIENLEECKINIHSETETLLYKCFHCGTEYNIKDEFCPNCDEEIVRCKSCSKPIEFDEYITSCATYGIIGKEDGVTGFLNVDHICESCMSSDKYSVL
ncbi:MAG: hypothetical protein ACFFDW_03550, partial [Candidatus Thorarchaeota archaeon]